MKYIIGCKIRLPRVAGAGVAVALGSLAAQSGAQAQTSATFVPTVTAAYNTAANWNPTVVPNAVGSSATFSTPTAAQTVSLGAAITDGAISLTNNGTFVFTLSNGTGGSLTFSASSGNATLGIGGTAVITNVLSATTTLTSTLDTTVSDTATTSITGALQITGALSGAGGFIKDGNGSMSFATAAKTYMGATTINAGLLRASVAGEATATSGVTVNSGGTLSLAATSTGQTIQFGTSTATVITLNGVGTTSLQGVTVAAGAGALQANGNATTLSNNVAMATDSTISTVTGLTLSGTVTGAGALTKTGVSSLTLTSANSYTGTTTVAAGTLLANNTTGSATSTNTVAVTGGTLGGSGTISGAVTVSSGATIQGGIGAAAGALTLSSPLTLNTGSIVQIALGSGLGHSTLVTAGASFDPQQTFKFLLGTGTTIGTYSGIITGLTADPGTEANWVATATDGNFMGTFAYNAGNIDLNVTSVPEPTTVLGGLMLLGAAGWSQRRRLRGALLAA